MTNVKGIKTESDALKGAIEALRRNAPAVAESVRILYDAFIEQGFSHEDAIGMALEMIRQEQ